MRSCRKCQEPIPNKVVIDGKERNLQNRKFCLECSPFGSRNTKPDDPSRPSVKGGNYSEWTDARKCRNRAMQYYYRTRRMRAALDLKGGSCVHCGYDKCTRALHFHHKDPELKTFSLDARSMLSHSWESLLKELDKCDLVCANCHGELHENESIHVPLIIELYGEDWKNGSGGIRTHGWHG